MRGASKRWFASRGIIIEETCETVFSMSEPQAASAGCKLPR